MANPADIFRVCCTRCNRVARLREGYRMSFVIAAPEFVSAAASDLAGIGSSLSAANAAASVPTTAVLAAAGDEVSA